MKRWSFRWLPGVRMIRRFRFPWGWRLIVGPLWVEHYPRGLSGGR